MLTGPRITICVVLVAVLVGVAPADDDTTPLEAHRAFRLVIRPKLPEVRGIARTSVDRFILATAQTKRLTLAPEADRATLIRRVCFGLTGLPPTVAELDAFLRDKAPHAYEKMVERYLASPHYGERWGKFWLDAAGYADSNGYFNADTDRPLAWKNDCKASMPRRVPRSSALWTPKRRSGPEHRPTSSGGMRSWSKSRTTCSGRGSRSTGVSATR